MGIKISHHFQRLKAPETGRLVVQLTSGDAQCYPLYYFVPTITRDGRFLVYHKAEAETCSYIDSNWPQRSRFR